MKIQQARAIQAGTILCLGALLPLVVPLCDVIARTVEPLGASVDRVERLKHGMSTSQTSDDRTFTYLGEGKVELGGVLVLEEFLDLFRVFLAREVLKCVLDQVVEREVALETLVELCIGNRGQYTDTLQVVSTYLLIVLLEELGDATTGCTVARETLLCMYALAQ